MASSSRLLTIVGMWGFASGPIGFGKIWILGLKPGVGLTCSCSPFFGCQGPSYSVVSDLVQPHLIDADFRKAWMLFFCRSGHPVVTVDQFLDFIGHVLPQERQIDLPNHGEGFAGGCWG